MPAPPRWRSANARPRRTLRRRPLSCGRRSLRANEVGTGAFLGGERRSVSETSAGFASFRPMLQAGRNCWRIERAQRAALIVDAADYFRLARQAMLKARSQILLIGWDFDTRID